MLINISDLNKSFGENQILNNINLTIEDNARYGLIGVNGAGKSTLLDIIMGNLDYDSGEIYKESGLTIGYLKQNSGLDRSSTIIQEMRGVFSDLLKIRSDMRGLEEKMKNIGSESSVDDPEYKSLMSEYSKKQAYFESRNGYNIDVKIKMILNGMGFSDKSLDTSIASLSGGEKTRLAIASLLLRAPKLLILDEPTNHLDFKTLEWLENYLVNDYKGALLIVSHDRYFLDVTVQNMLELERRRLYEYKGNYSKYLVLKAERLALQKKKYEAQQAEIERLETYVEKNITRASTSASAKSRVKALENMELIEKPDSEIQPIRLKFEYLREPYKDVLRVNDLDICVGSERRVICRNIDLDLKRGEKVALIGSNGIGKSSFLKTVLGLIPYEKGDIEWGKNTSVSYYEQENLNLDPEKRAIDELRDRFPRVPDARLRRVLGNVRLSQDDVFKPVKVISGGERAKLAFCVIMLEKSNVILFDEPTNHLDLPSKEVLESAMCDYGGTLLFVSHDRYLLGKVPDKIIEMTENGFVVYDGNYEYYKERKAFLERREKAEEEEEKAKAQSLKNHGKSAQNTGHRSKEQRRAEVMRKQRVAELERLIEEAEAEISELEQELAKPEVYSDYKLMNEKTERMQSLSEALENYYEEWQRSE